MTEVEYLEAVARLLQQLVDGYLTEAETIRKILTLADEIEAEA